VSSPLIRALAMTFAQNPGMAAWLLAQHIDDGTGRCRVCSVGPAGRRRWPCKIHWYATQALALRHEIRSRST
jgi:hypothetical protein